MTKLSFIVPVYNVAPYLRKCVDSLLAQDYDNYEIILVDDGSTDDSPQICDELAEGPTSDSSLKGRENQFTQNTSHIDAFEDGHNSRPLQGRAGVRPPIRVIHQVNAGLSAARNAGILAARGEYLCFVDSDDYWQPNVLGGLMTQVERENLDVLRFDYQNVRIADGQESRVKSQEHKYEVFEPNKAPRYIDRKNEIVDGETYLNTRMGYACYAVMFILRRDLILPTRVIKKDSFPSGRGGVGLLFTPGLHFEDVDWLPRMMLRAKRVNSTQTIVYNYFIRQGSITKTQGDKEKIRKNLEDRMKIIETYSAYLKQNPSCYWLKNMQSNMVSGVLTTVAQSFYQERKEYISRLEALNVFPLSIADQGKSYIRKAKLINLSPRTAMLLLYYKNLIRK